MPGVLGRRARRWARRKERALPMGFSWIFVITDDAAMVLIVIIAALQRPMHDWPMSSAALLVALIPWALYTARDFRRHRGLALFVAWTSAAAILLFATSTPVAADFAPLLLGLGVAVVNILNSIRESVFAVVVTTALLALAAALHRVDEPPVLYFAFIGIGWLIGYLIRNQQALIVEQRQMQAELEKHAAADERRRILREVHDVIAHSLSVTLLHLTGARHALERSGRDSDAIGALHRAEKLGRQAMADIRRIVGLIDGETASRVPTPGVDDIQSLAADFSRAGLEVAWKVDGPAEHLSAATGLALYRIAQESLSNVAKHAPDSTAEVSVEIKTDTASVSVVNRSASAALAQSFSAGRGTNGMRQRVALFGGLIEIGPTDEGWSVRAKLPLDHGDAWSAGAVDLDR